MKKLLIGMMALTSIVAFSNDATILNGTLSNGKACQVILASEGLMAGMDDTFFTVTKFGVKRTSGILGTTAQLTLGETGYRLATYTSDSRQVSKVVLEGKTLGVWFELKTCFMKTDW